MKLILVRHGETFSNEKGIIQGRLNGRKQKLNSVGIIQAKGIGKKFKKSKIDLIYSSRLKRAKQTAKIVKKELNVKLMFDKRLNDRKLGDLQGKKQPKHWNKSLWDSEFVSYHGGEMYLHLRRRVKKFLLNLLEKYPDKTILIITHKAIFQIIIGIIKGYKEEELKKIHLKKNPSGRILEIKEI